MSKPIQLRVPAPCQERWTDMQPTEKGRHCQSCCKTVVDFTNMSDTEIVRYLAQAGVNVCGRLAPDQLNRPLLPLAPPQRNGWSGWRYLLAGALVISKGSDHHQPVNWTIGKMVVASDTSRVEDVLVGKIGFSGPECRGVDDSVLPPEVRIVKDEDAGYVLGTMSKLVIDSTQQDSFPAPPMKPMIDAGKRPDEDNVFLGGIVVKQDSIVDTVKQWVADTLTTLKLLPKAESGWTMYPNPVMRGSALRFSGQTEKGVYHMSLFSAAGALIQERVLEVSGPGQVDSWEMPARLAAGVYFIRVVRAGQAGVWTQEVVVE